MECESDKTPVIENAIPPLYNSLGSSTYANLESNAIALVSAVIIFSNIWIAETIRHQCK